MYFNDFAGLKISQCIRFRQHSTMTACWVWTGYISPKGVPQTHGTTARRAVWTKMRGRLRDNEQLRALCRQGDCVNPHHMKRLTVSKVA